MRDGQQGTPDRGDFSSGEVKIHRRKDTERFSASARMRGRAADHAEPLNERDVVSAMISTCWADCLGGCSKESSQEHVISATVFTDGLLTVKGLQWLNGAEKLLPKSRLTAGVLCKRHNELLSPVDAEAGRLSILLRQIAKGTNPPTFAINGWLLERWCLKVLVNLATSGWSIRRAQEVLCHYVEAIFGIRKLAGGSGLYIPETVAIEDATDVDFCRWAVMTNVSDDSEIHGLLISVRHFVMATMLSESATPAALSKLLSSAPGYESFVFAPDMPVVHRPKAITIGGGDGVTTNLTLEW